MSDETRLCNPTGLNQPGAPADHVSDLSDSKSAPRRIENSLMKPSSSKHEDVRRENSRKRPCYLTDLRGKQRVKATFGVSGVVKEDRLSPNFDTLPIICADDLRDKNWSRARSRSQGSPSDSEIGPSEAERNAGVDVHQKKHKINWLAEDVKHRETLLLEKSATGKEKKKSTAMKYGW